MSLSHKTRKRLSLFVLLVWMPVFVVIAVTVMNRLFPDPLNRPSILVELGIYLGLGLICFLPFRRIFLGVGQPDPNEDPSD